MVTAPDERLRLHLSRWVGQWPPPVSGITVVGSPERLASTWDGSIRPLLGVGNGVGTVIAVPPVTVDSITAVFARDSDDIGDELGAVLGTGSARFGSGVFRSTHRVTAGIPDIGEWFDEQTDELPPWLAPFNGPRLVVRDEHGATIAGVGIKVHDPFGHELSVVTEEAARGQGLARRLVATAARRILDEGAIPTYLHDPANHASASVARAVGFADEGWTVHGLWPNR